MTTAKVPKAATWKLADSDTIGSKAQIKPSSTTDWTNYYAGGSTIKLGFAGPEFAGGAAGAAAPGAT